MTEEVVVAAAWKIATFTFTLNGSFFMQLYTAAPQVNESFIERCILCIYAVRNHRIIINESARKQLYINYMHICIKLNARWVFLIEYWEINFVLLFAHHWLLLKLIWHWNISIVVLLLIYNICCIICRWITSEEIANYWFSKKNFLTRKI